MYITYIYVYFIYIYIYEYTLSYTYYITVGSNPTGTKVNFLNFINFKKLIKMKIIKN